jgi:hypothetical protein
VTGVDASRPLEEIVGNRRWEKRLRPFPHVYVQDLFVDSVAEEIEVAVQKILKDTSLGGIDRYDASGWSFAPDVDWPLRLFVTDGWRSLLSRVLGVDTIPYVSGGIHHHDVGGESGRPHNDLNPVYFADAEPRDGMVILRGNLVDLKTGEVRSPGTQVLRTVRAISILYYTANPPWHPGDGGETGLYGRRTVRVHQPTVAADRGCTPGQQQYGRLRVHSQLLPQLHLQPELRAQLRNDVVASQRHRGDDPVGGGGAGALAGIAELTGPVGN